MLAIIGGIVLIIVAVVLWFGHISLDHALAIFIGIIGIIVLLAGVLPGQYWTRNGNRTGV
jgi:hypothetical protein